MQSTEQDDGFSALITILFGECELGSSRLWRVCLGKSRLNSLQSQFEIASSSCCSKKNASEISCVLESACSVPQTEKDKMVGIHVTFSSQWHVFCIPLKITVYPICNLNVLNLCSFPCFSFSVWCSFNANKLQLNRLDLSFRMPNDEFPLERLIFYFRLVWVCYPIFDSDYGIFDDLVYITIYKS